MKNVYIADYKSIFSLASPLKLFIVLMGLLFLSHSLRSQCTTGPAWSSTYTPLCNGTLENWATGMWAGEYATINLTAGVSYAFSSTISTDFITIANNSNIAQASGTGTVNFTPSISGIYRVYLHVNSSCGTNTSSRNPRVQCSSGGGTPPPAGCNSGVPWSTAYTPLCNGTLENWATGMWAGEYATINLTAGVAYSFTSTISTDFLTITNNSNVIQTSGTGPVNFTPTLSGVYRVYIHANSSCATQSASRNPRVQCGGSGPPPPPGCASGILFTSYSPLCIGSQESYASCTFAGEYNNLSLTGGVAYTFGSSISTDYITITNNTGGILTAGTQPVNFTPSSTGQYRVYIHANSSCLTASTCRTPWVQCGTVTPPPANNLCSGATIVPNCGGTYSGSTVNATNAGNGGTCITGASTAPGVWYTIQGTGATITADVCVANFDTKLFVYSGNCSSLACVTGNKNFCGLQSQVSFTGVQGTTYYILVTGFGAATGTFTLNVNVSSPATPVFALGSTSSRCQAAGTATYSATATGSTSISYVLNPGTAGTINSSTGAVTWNSTFSGSATITATASGCGTNSQAVHTVTVNPIPTTPVVSAGGSTTICPGTQLTLNSTAGAGTLWSNGQSGASTSVSAAGSYTATNVAAGCTSAVSNAVTVSLFPTPVAPAISAGGGTTFCQGDSVTLSSTGGASTNWSQGSTGANLVVLTPGTYSATATDANGCVSGPSNTIAVTVNNLPPAPTLSPSGPQAICLGNSLTVSASEPSGIQWSNGQSGTTQSFSIQGIYTATYTDGNGCTSPSSQPLDLTVNPLPLAPQIIASGPTVFCNGDSVILVSTYAFGNTWTGGTTDTFLVVKQSGAFLVNHTDLNGCTSPNSTPVLVNVLALPVPPVISAAGQTAFCSGNQVTLSSDYSQGNTWSNGAQTASIQATQQDVYTAVYTDNNGCTSLPSNSIAVTVNPLPVIQALSLPATCELGVAQIGQQSQVSTQNGAAIVQYNWLLGDGNNASGSAVSHVYTQTGNLQVLLQVTTNHGCQDTLSGQIAVNPKPSINSIITADVCEGFVANFSQNTALSQVNGAQLLNYSWNFGDGQTGTGATTSHLYASTGAFPIQLIVGSNHGCFDTAETTLLVNPAPQIASLTASTVCEGLLTDLAANASISSVNGALISSFGWNFGDGSPQTQGAAQIAHQYLSPGSYNASVQVASNQGCLDSAQVSLWVNPKPSLTAISVPQVCDGIVSQGTVNVSVLPLNGAQVQNTVWTHGDGTGSSSASFSHLYSAPGSYTVKVIATTNHGCVDSIQTTALVNPLPVIGSLQAVTVCEGEGFNFSQSAQVASVNNAQVTQFAWNFGDGANGTGQAPTHTYMNEGNFTGQLQVTTNHGCSDLLTFPVTINPTPVIQTISAPAVCDGNTSTFHESIQYTGFNGGVIQSLVWNSGDGGTYSTQGPVVHQYASPGAFTVSLKIVTSHGCSDSVATTQLIHENPVIQSNQVAPVCLGTNSQFNPQISLLGVNGAIIDQYVWDFGNGSTSSQAAPGVVYAAPGIYTAELIVLTQFGCSDTALTNVTVYDLPQPAFLIDTLCLGSPGSFLNTSQISQGQISTYYWTFGDNAGFSNQQDPSYTYSAPGVYNVTLTATSDNGCVNSIQLPVYVNISPASTFTPALTAPFTLQFTPDFLQQGQSYLWNFGDGQVSTQASPIHQYAQPGQYQVCLTVSDNTCSSQTCAAIQLNSTGGIKVDELLQGLSLYPNPVSSNSRLSFSIQERQVVNWNIMDISGRILTSGSFGELAPGTYNEVVGHSFNTLPSGVYMLSVSAGSSSTGVRFVKIYELD